MENSKSLQKIAILGGTFNPIHNGHIYIAQQFAEKLSLCKVLFVPTYIAPHKESKDLASAHHRLKMCEIAAKVNPIFEASDIEIRRGGKSYTVDTLKEFNSLYPDSQFYLLCGADMFTTLHQWKNYKEIMKLAVICSLPRDEQDFDILSKYAKGLEKDGAHIILLDSPKKTVSSTEIRNLIAKGRDIREFVPSEVLSYINTNSLYKG